MNTVSFQIPEKLLALQNKLNTLRNEGKLLLQNGDTGNASAPSNIALIKYWGKSRTEFQIPDNPSLSFTLNNFRSTTQVTVLGRFFPEGETPKYIPQYEFYLSDPETNNTVQPDEKMELQRNIPEKLNVFLKNILSPFAADISVKIESYNNFPTACGMASSASGMAALTLAIANLLNLEKHFSKTELQYWLAQWARMGSGSAIRSVSLAKNSQFVSWEMVGTESTIKNIPTHKKWNQLRHCVFALNSKPKEIKSSDGHMAAHTSPLHLIRVNNVKENFLTFKKALKNFNFEFVSSFTENDAFNMHAVMQTSIPPATYLNHKVSFVISEFIEFRKKEKIKAFWTLDAGPNIHFLYLSAHRKKMMKFHKEVSTKLKLSSFVNLTHDIKIYE